MPATADMTITVNTLNISPTFLISNSDKKTPVHKATGAKEELFSRSVFP